ncbi:helix-turn-helix domain-containing protein [Sediminicola luteus]|nr:helix-turn-helix domain-containing protein [Sediminicola luteus]
MENNKDIKALLTAMHIDAYRKCDDFHILKFEDHLDKIPRKTVNRKCGFFQVYFSRQYNVDVVIDDSAYSAKDKTIISFVAPQQTLSVDVKEVEALSNGYMLVFEPSFLNSGLTDFDIQRKFPYFNQNYPPLYSLEKNPAVFIGIFERIYALFENLSLENLEIIRSYLNILLYESRKSFYDGGIRNSMESRGQRIAFTFESLIREHSHSRNTLDFYADKLNISTVYLSECIKKATGKTGKQLIDEYTILEASTLLMQTTDTVDQISDTLGFSATSNFINFFKKHTGQPPLKYRYQLKA